METGHDRPPPLGRDDGRARPRHRLFGPARAPRPGRQPRRRRLAACSPWRSTARRRGLHLLKSRIDADENTIKNYRTALKRACSRFGDRDPNGLSAAEVAKWVGELAQTYKPGTVQQYVVALRLLLDFTGAEPNVARDPRVKLPKQTREEPQPPSAEHLLAILEAIGPR
jgi:site-specific recombinase XerD